VVVEVEEVEEAEVGDEEATEGVEIISFLWCSLVFNFTFYFLTSSGKISGVVDRRVAGP